MERIHDWRGEDSHRYISLPAFLTVTLLIFLTPCMVTALKSEKLPMKMGDHALTGPFMLEAVGSSYSFEETMLMLEYQTICLKPFQYRGFFGLKNMLNGEAVRADLIQMKEFGVNALTVDIYISFVKPSTDGDGMSIDLDEFNRYLDNYEQFIDLCDEMNIFIFINIITGTNFQFLPDWVYDRYPDVAALDQNGETVKSFLGNKPWVSVEHAAVNEIKREMIRAVVERFRNKRNVVAWGLDGETFYGTYFYPEHWFDYSENAICHYREWLKKRYGTIKALNEAWNKSYAGFDEVDPPRLLGRNAESMDWHRYRISSITEYVAWQYRLVKSLDPTRLVFGFMADCPYRNQELVRAGSSPVDYLSITDGWCGTIINRMTDFVHYNTLYRMVIGSFKKPIQASESFIEPFPTPYLRMFRFLYEHLGMGIWYMGIGTWDVPLDGGTLPCQNKGTQAEFAIRTVYSEVSRMPLEYMWPIKPKIAVYLSELTWIMDGFKPSWTALHASLIELHYPFRYIFSRQIVNDEIKEIPIIISVENEMVENEVVDKLDVYIREGGNLVIVGDFYKEDQHVKATTTPAFLKSDENWINISESVSYRVIKYGKGKVLQIRKEENYENSITDLLIGFFQQVGILKPVIVTANLPNGEDVSRSIEVFTLSDGINFAIVMINLVDSKVQLEVQINAEACLDREADYMVRELRSGNLLDRFRKGAALNLNMAIEPNSAAVLYVERKTSREEVTTLLSRIEGRLNSLAGSGVDATLAKYFKYQAQHFYERGQYSKALACVYKALNQLFLKIEAASLEIVTGSQFNVAVKLNDFDGMPVENATVIASYMDKEIPLQYKGKGEYALKVNTSILSFYNYFGKEYSPITGRIEFSIRAEKNGKYGRTSLTLNMLLRDRPVDKLIIEADTQVTAPRWSMAVIVLKVKDGSGIPIGGANVTLTFNSKIYQCRNLGDEYYFTAIPINVAGDRYIILITSRYEELSAESTLTLIVSEPHSPIFGFTLLAILLLGIILAYIFLHKGPR